MNNKGSLFPDDFELDSYRGYLNEATQRLGRSGKFYQVLESKVIDTDTYYKWGTPVDVSYILDSRPKIKLLEKFGWNVEGSVKPMICYMSFLDSENRKINPTEGSVLEISSKINIKNNDLDTRKFQVVDAQTDFEMNMFICNLAPFREKLETNAPFPTPNNPSMENQFFKREDTYNASSQR